MTKNELDMLKIDIREIQIENISAKIMMLKEYFSLLFNILIKKGFSDNYLKELNKAKFEYLSPLPINVLKTSKTLIWYLPTLQPTKNIINSKINNKILIIIPLFKEVVLFFLIN